MRIKIIKSTYKYRVGDIVDVSKNEGFGLIDSGYGIKSKDMTVRDYKTKRIKNG
jgi:hypothetical protein